MQIREILSNAVWSVAWLWLYGPRTGVWCHVSAPLRMSEYSFVCVVAVVVVAVADDAAALFFCMELTPPVSPVRRRRRRRRCGAAS